jgi:hypothetical protein
VKELLSMVVEEENWGWLARAGNVVGQTVEMSHTWSQSFVEAENSYEIPAIDCSADNDEVD